MRSQTAWPTRWLPIAQHLQAVALEQLAAARGSSRRRRAPRRRRSGRPSRRARGRRSPSAPAFSASSVSGRSAHWPVNSVTGRAIEARRIWSHMSLCGSRSRAAARVGCTSRSCSSAWIRRTRWSSTSATRRTTRSASASCSATRRWPRSRPPIPESYAEITRRFVRWSEIDVHYRGEVITSGGHGFSAMGRKELLDILQTRAAELGVDLRFRSEVTALEGDLVVAADGVNSTLRARYALRARRWTGAGRRTRGSAPTHVFEAFTFLIAETAARRRPGPRLSLQRRDEHVHRRDDRRRCGSTRRRARRCSATS